MVKHKEWKTRVFAVALALLLSCSAVSESYIRAEAVGTSIVAIADVFCAVLLALGIGIAVDYALLNEDNIRIFCNNLNVKVAGLGDRLYQKLTDAVSAGIRSLVLDKTLWDDLRSATETVDGLVIDYNQSFDFVSESDMINFLRFYGYEGIVDSSLVQDFLTSNTGKILGFVVLNTSDGSYGLGGFVSNYVSFYSSDNQFFYFDCNPWPATVLYVYPNGVVSSRQYNSSIGIFVSQSSQSLVISSNIILSTGSKISNVFVDEKIIGHYDIVTKGRSYTPTDGLTGDVTLNIPISDNMESIWNNVNEGTMDVIDAQEQIGVIAVDTDTDVAIGDDSLSISEALEQVTAIDDSDIGYYALDLTALFPFCIPFDIYDFLRVFVADPVAPSFTFKFPSGGFLSHSLTYTEITIDLSDFDGVAQVVRTVEGIAFCVGLAFVTRSMFIRG